MAIMWGTSNGSFKIGQEITQTPYNSDMSYADATVQVTAKVYIKPNAGVNISQGSGFSLVVTGGIAPGTYPVAVNASANQQVLVKTLTMTVATSTTADITTSAQFDLSGWTTNPSLHATVTGSIMTLKRPNGSGQVALSSTGFEMGTGIAIDTNRADPSYTVTLRWGANGSSGTFATGVTGRGSWDFPVATFAPLTPNSSTLSAFVSAEYYNSSGTMVSNSQTWITLTVPASVGPTISTFDLADLRPGGLTVGPPTPVGMLVQGISQPMVTMTADPAYGSTIVSTKFTAGGIDYPPLPPYYERTALLPSPANSGQLSITASATDARGHTSTLTITPTVLAYAIPKITAFQVARCDTNGTLNDVGNSVKITSAGNVSSLVNVTEKNSLTWKLYSRVTGATDWGTAIKSTGPSASPLTWTSTDVLGLGAYLATSAYEFKLEVIDKFNTTLSIVAVPTGTVTMSWSRNGVGISKVWQQGALDVGGQIYQNGLPVADSSTIAAGPKGVVFSAAAPLFSDVGCTTAYGFGEVAFTPTAGRLYRLTWHPPLVYVTAPGTVMGIDMRCTTNGTRPLTTTPSLRNIQYHVAVAGLFQIAPDITVLFSVSTAPANPWRFLGTVGRVGGTATCTARGDNTTQALWWTIEDLGPTTTIAGNAVVANTGL